MATQLERRTATRARLLDAAVDTLRAKGVAGFTTTEVVRVAGVSQGALFKHFATKAELLGATVGHIFDRLVASYEEAFDRRIGVDGGMDAPEARVAAGLDLLWEVFGDESLHAAYELYTVARTDPQLRADLEPVVSAHLARIHEVARVLFPEAHRRDPDRLRDAIDLVVAAMQGQVLQGLAVPDPDTAGRVLATLGRWATERLIEMTAPEPSEHREELR